MGSWNGTCGISQMSIKHGTEIKVVVIRNKGKLPTASGFCYTGGYAELMSFAFDGVYDDYGSVEDIKEGTGIDLFMSYLKVGLKKGTIKIDPDEYYDREMNIEDGEYGSITAKQAMDIIERDRMFEEISYIESDERVTKWANIGIMMFHKTVYDSLVESMFGENVRNDDYSHNNDTILADAVFAVEDLFISPVNEYGISWEAPIRKSRRWGNVVREFGSNDGMDWSAFYWYATHLSKTIKDRDRYEVAYMIATTIKLIFIMSSLRKPWMGQAEKGSQNFDVISYEGLIKGMTKAIHENRDELEGDSLYCYKEWVLPEGTFVKGESYECVHVNYGEDRIEMKLNNITVVMTWNNYLEYFDGYE